MIRAVFFFLLCLIMAGCAVGPDYIRPPAPIPPKFKEANGKHIIAAKKNGWKLAEPSDGLNRGLWWQIFHDPILNDLEDRVNIDNQNIKNAYYNFQNACAQVAEAEASWLPTLTGSVSLTRQKSGGGVNVNNNINVVSPSNPTVSRGTGFSTSTSGKIDWVHQIAFNASWEIDLWGAIRRQVEANVSAAMASSAQLSAMRLSMQSQLAVYYFQLRGLDADQNLLNETVASYKRNLKLTRNEYNAGTVSRADVVQAQSQLEGAQSQAINNHILRQQYEHAIATLIGVPPDSLTIIPESYKFNPPPIPLMIPSALLERRPDIAQAERLMAQANAQIGIAVAAFFPTLNLTGSASVTATGLGHWFSLPALAWAFGGQLIDTILDGGLRNAQVAAAKANYKALVASYRQIVLAAFQDVEDNLVSLQTLNKQIKVQHRAVISAERALQIVMNQYRAGTTNFLAVMVQQAATYNAQKTEIDVDYQRMVAAVNLVRSLGGGWDGVVCA